MELTQIFSIPFWQSEYPDFEENKQFFIDTIKKYKEDNPSVKKSNIVGYQSPPTLQQIPELFPLFQYACQIAFSAVADMDFVDCNIAITSSWVNINDSRQCMNREHIHNDVFSGIFYLQIPEGSGKLNIINPSINRLWSGFSCISQKNQYTAESISIEPIEGSIIIFPSYLPHFVETNDHDEERISISFNIITIPKDQSNYLKKEE